MSRLGRLLGVSEVRFEGLVFERVIYFFGKVEGR